MGREGLILEEILDDVFHGDAFAGCVVVRDDAVPEDGEGDGADFLLLKRHFVHGVK